MSQISLQNGVAPTAGYAGWRDVHISGYQPTFNRGGADLIEIGAYTGGSPPSQPSHGLFYTDITGLGISGTVNSAPFKMTQKALRNASTKTVTFTHYRIIRGLWQEGTRTGVDGQTSLTGDVTFNNFAEPGTAWGTAGAENTSSDITTTGAVSSGSLVFNSTTTIDTEFNLGDLAAFYQYWVDHPSENYGWKTKVTTGDNNNGGIDFYDKANATTSKRPRIHNLDYTAGGGGGAERQQSIIII